jgi:hypothetical protein
MRAQMINYYLTIINSERNSPDLILSAAFVCFCVSVVAFFLRTSFHHKGTEDTKVAQSKSIVGF